MVSSLVLLASVVGQVLLRLAHGAIEIAVARFVKADEEDEHAAILEVQDTVLLPGEARPQLAERRALDRARVWETKPRAEELEPLDRLSHLRSVSRRQVPQKVDYRRSSSRCFVEPDLPSFARRHRCRYNTLGIIPRVLSP